MNIIPVLRDTIADALRESGLCITTEHHNLIWIEQPDNYIGPVCPIESAALDDSCPLALITFTPDIIEIHTLMDPNLGLPIYAPPYWTPPDQGLTDEDPYELTIELDYCDHKLIDILINPHGPLATAYHYSN